MSVKTFAAIMIGSAETEMRIYEYTPQKKMRQIDCVSTRINLGEDAYTYGRLDPGKVAHLCEVLSGYKTLMEGYQVDGCRVCATSALREIRSSQITREYIEKQTGLKIRIITNSEQRFLDYKSIACESDYFSEIIKSGTAIVDIGGSSTQISFFDNDKLVTTQNIRMGKISTRNHYLNKSVSKKHYESIIRELLEHELNGFAKLYQKEKERQTKNLIVVDQDLQDLVRSRFAQSVKTIAEGKESVDVFRVSADQFRALYERMMEMKTNMIASQFELTGDSASLVMQSMIFCNILVERTGAQNIWLMDVSICDGLSYDFGVTNKLLVQTHDFEEDIIASARNIARRYKSNQPHIRLMEHLCTELFNRTKKVHRMGHRERLLLQISAILHNCGKYISLVNVSDCAYNIIMATEIIGLSHQERKIIACVVKYNTEPFTYDRNHPDFSDLSREQYLTVAKLTAILRIANALDRSHKQKCRDAVISIRDKELVISVKTQEDLTLEKITLADREEFFEEIFNLHPVLKQKK